ncbi:MAG: exodeoxyribonuclease VII small subunit [Actinomycetota bacterium]
MSKIVDPTPPWNYEVAVAKIEEIISLIESGNLSLEEVFEEFTIACEYLQQCQTFLDRGKQQMNLLVETLAELPDF